ncbi:hypothetical protein EVJ29_13130 [Exiguobacterium sp. SH4S7]|uniref:hypothetical protein n=1 Tax=Exiguobacterium sp. SH4S7 TaxID=2510958 RepID=UPI00103D6927|nr:hypothetical protein [Exiguobacterium sp. SH4S7]TCI33827.1 hypothetical protein EVJ29_13130 [Exiguobacterium sp. SH4S7]
MKDRFVYKSSVLALSSVLVFSGLGGVSANESQGTNPSVKQGSLDVSQEGAVAQDENFDQYINSLEGFVQKNLDGTIRLKEGYEALNVPSDVIEGVTAWMSYLNDEVAKGTILIQDDLSVTYTSPPSLSLQQNYKSFATASASTGVNGFSSYWWGYKLYLNNTNTKRLANSMYSGASGAALAVAVSGMVPTAPSLLVKGIAGALAVGGTVAGREINNINKGKGVYIRFTGRVGVGPGPIFTGVIAQ